jgi:dihydrofolate synthase/folylpolyglutamate synthase
MNYQETLQYLYDRLPVFHLVGSSAYKPGLENTYRLMAQLDNPHQKFRSIHVAGTNGKGSVSHYLAAILQEAGYKVGLYTSPHLVDFGERIRINGQMIDQQYVIDYIQKHIDAIETIQPSFFELTMAMAFSYFADKQVDIAVIEAINIGLDKNELITRIDSIKEEEI